MSSMTTSPSPRILVSPDSPLRLEKSPLGRAKRTFSTETSFQPASLHPNALLDADERTSSAVRKQLGKGSADLKDSIAKLTALRLEDGRGATLFSPRPMETMQPARSGTSLKVGSTAEAEVAKLAAREVINFGA